MATRPEPQDRKPMSVGMHAMFFLIPFLIIGAIETGLNYFDNHPNDQLTIIISK